MSWGGYIPGDMIRAVVEEGKLDEFLDTFYGRDYSEEMEDGEWEGEETDEQ